MSDTTVRYLENSQKFSSTNFQFQDHQANIKYQNASNTKTLKTVQKTQ